MRSRKFPTFDEAIKYLEERGKLEYFGRVGYRAEQCVYTFFHRDGRVFGLRVHDDGKVEITD